MSKLPVFLLIITHIQVSLAANILAILGLPFYSHQLVHHHLMSELIRRGHNLTIFTSHPMDYDTENVIQHNFTEFYDLAKDGADMLSQKRKKMGTIEIWTVHEKKFRFLTAKSQLSSPELRDIYLNPQNNHFDLILMECMKCPFAFLADIYDCPIVMTSAGQIGVYEQKMIGNCVHPALHPELFSSDAVHGKLDIFERVNSIIGWIQSAFYDLMISSAEDQLIRDSFPSLEFKAYEDVMRRRVKVFYGFLNTLTTCIRPSIPSYQHVGFIHLKPPKQLENHSKIKKFLDASARGVILVSFGSIAKDFDAQLSAKFASIFSRVNFDVLWKTSGENVKLTENVMTADWIPIADVLAHPNLRLMIGHAGTRSIEEAVDRMVPMILFPLGYDQPFSANLHADQGIAMTLDLNEFTEVELIGAIHEMMKEEYRENLRHFRRHVYDQMSSSVDIAVENIEYLMRHNESFHYQSYEGQNVSDVTRYSFDIYLIIASFVCLAAAAFRQFYRFILKKFF